MRRCVAVLLVSALAAQEARPRPTPAPAADGVPRLYDFVVAMVGDKAILASQVTELWRARVQSIPGTEAPTRLHLLWYETAEALVGREMQAQSARLMGRSPEEVEAQVERLVQDELRRQAEEAGGLNEFVRKMGGIGGSMNTVVEEARTRILYSMAHYQGILRDLQDQYALLATPKEMLQRFRDNPGRFENPGRAAVAARRIPLGNDPSAANAEAERVAGEWRALPQPLTREALTAAGGQVIELSFRDPTSILLEFAQQAATGTVAPPRADGQFLWILALVEKIDSKPGRFEDPEVQAQLRDELARARRQEVYDSLFQEQRVGVDRYPWGEPSQMEGRGRPPARR